MSSTPLPGLGPCRRLPGSRSRLPAPRPPRPAGAGGRAGPADRRGAGRGAPGERAAGRARPDPGVLRGRGLVRPGPSLARGPLLSGHRRRLPGPRLGLGAARRRPAPSWLVLGFVLANAALLTVTLLVPNPFVQPLTPVQMALRPPKFLFFLLLVAWATFTLSPRLVLGAALVAVATWSGASASSCPARHPPRVRPAGGRQPGRVPGPLPRPHFVDSARPGRAACSPPA